MQYIQWFENNYVHGRFRRIIKEGNISRTAPLFPPKFQSVFKRMELEIPRTQNRVENWRRHFKTLFRKFHVGVYTIIEETKKKQIQIERRAEDNIIRGRSYTPTQRKSNTEREKRISTIINDRKNNSNLLFVKEIAHNIKF